MRDFELPGRSAVHAANGMAATPHPLATRTAIDVLQAGGNAMDAALAANAVLGVVEPAMTGVGGDCVILYAPKGGADITAFMGIGRAPQAATLEWYKQKGINHAPTLSPHMVAVPGLVDAWHQLSRDHGTWPLAKLLAQAIAYAEDGHPVHERVARDWTSLSPILARDPGSKGEFLASGAPPKPGTIHRRPALAATLKRIAAEGRDGFYRGPVAEDIVATLRALGGLHTLEDFAAFQGEYVATVATTYRGVDLLMCPPPSLGLVTQAALNILSHFDLAGLEPLSAARLHLAVESARLAYAERSRLPADGVDATAVTADILSAARAKTLAGRIDPNRAMDKVASPPKGGPAETTYLCVVDRERNAVSFMSTIVDFFGSRVTAPKSGVILNSRGEYYNSDAADPNCWAPRKRPLSYSLPAMARKDGRTVMPFGLVGGSFQPMGMALVFSNMVDFGMDVQEALTAPRVFSQDGVLDYERGLPDHTALDLAARGHKVVRRSEGPRRANGPLGGGQAIWIDGKEGVLTGGADPRNDGAALGY
ncbi:MAG: gamma-glutamyltransferase family protein [Alphaproteobacteria bacterium]|nr:gamma-glutamyltransferase family protein [Alphaproteobacteria bacterium]